jgi:hypothetical protein
MTIIFAIVLGLCFFVWARLYASQEVSIEGPVGWAIAAPTWKTKNKLYGAAMSGKVLTGYHLTMFILPLFFLHLPILVPLLAWNTNLFTVSRELELFAYYFVLCTGWDFMWFVLNPAYGLKRFRKGEIQWHKEWIGRLPKDYVVGFATVIGFTIGAGYLDFHVFGRMLIVLSVFGLAVAYTILTADKYCERLKDKIASNQLVESEWNCLTPDEFAQLKQCLGQKDELLGTIGRLIGLQAQREQMGKKA